MQCLHKAGSQCLTQSEKQTIAGLRLLHRQTVSLEQLNAQYPPKWDCQVKRQIQAMLFHPYTALELEISRWREMPLPFYWPPMGQKPEVCSSCLG